MAWLVSRLPEPIPVTPREVIEALPEFAGELARVRANWRDREPWHEIVLCAKRVSASLIER